MKTHNGYETITATPAAFSTPSTSKTKIVLPYTGELWGELLLEIQNAAYACFDSPDNCRSLIYYQQVVEAADIVVQLDIQRQIIRATAIADITATNGRTVQAKIRLVFTDTELTAILDRFFGGNPGLQSEYERLYKRFYETWKQKRASRAA